MAPAPGSQHPFRHLSQQLVHFEAVGRKGADDDRPLEKDDLFRIYSMTKPITAAAAMQLYEQGRSEVAQRIFNDRLRTPILRNELGDSAGVFGAAWLWPDEARE